MTADLHDVFADTVFWVALVVNQDQYHDRAQQWSQRIRGRIVTSPAVILETANTLSRVSWRPRVVALIEHLALRSDVEIMPLTPTLWQTGWDLYRSRHDKAWSLTDCISFSIMRDIGMTNALTADDHFRQAGFRTVLLDELE